MKSAFPRRQLAPSLSPGCCSICGATQTGALGLGECTNGHTLFEEQHALTIPPTDRKVVAMIDFKTLHPRSTERASVSTNGCVIALRLKDDARRRLNEAIDFGIEQQLEREGFGPVMKVMRAAAARLAPDLYHL